MPSRDTSVRLAAPAAALAGYVALGVQHRLAPGPREAKLFWRANGRPVRVLRAPQQLGTPWVLPGTAALAWAVGRRRLAVAAGLALPVEKGLEVGLKKLTVRPRPAKVWSGVHLRDDAPDEGPSYPSGHVAIATALAVLVSRDLSVAARCALAAVTAGTVGWARVEQGAHLPMDVVGGALLGTAVGTGLTALVDEVAPA